MSDLNLDALKELRNTHLKKLRNLFDTSHQPSEDNLIQIENIQLKEYFQHLHNSLDSSDTLKCEQEKAKKFKLNENILKESQAQRKRFDIDWNLEYCNACKIGYWPSNCTVYIEPKCRYTNTNAKLVTRHKLFNFKPKYKSYKDVLLKKLINKGVRLIYECKSCKAKNCILDEVKRPETKCVKTNKAQSRKYQEKLRLESEFTFNSKMSKSPLPTLSNQNNVTGGGEIVVRHKKINPRKKFQSLQTMLKQNEMEQDLIRKEQEKNKNKFGSLADFLQKIS
jgi:hypothetical protein